MTFTEWLTEYTGNNENVEMIAAWARGSRGETVLDACANLHDVEVVGRTSGLNDEAMEALRETWHAFLHESGTDLLRHNTPDPMGLPYAPGARTTLADARLQLVCAMLAGVGELFDVGEYLERADSILKAMRGSNEKA